MYFLFQICDCKQVRWTSRLSGKVIRSSVHTARPVKHGKQVKPVKRSAVSQQTGCFLTNQQYTQMPGMPGTSLTACQTVSMQNVFILHQLAQEFPM